MSLSGHDTRSVIDLVSEKDLAQAADQLNRTCEKAIREFHHSDHNTEAIKKAV